MQRLKHILIINCLKFANPKYMLFPKIAVQGVLQYPARAAVEVS